DHGRCPRDEVWSGRSPQAGSRRFVLVGAVSTLPPITDAFGGTFKERMLIRDTAGRAMQAHSFDYVRPQKLAKTIQSRSENGNRAKVLAGGQSLIPVLKLRLANPRLLVDINDLPGLAFIEERGDRLRIGALSRHCDFERSKLIQGKYPILSEVATGLGGSKVPNLRPTGGRRHAVAPGAYGG